MRGGRRGCVWVAGAALALTAGSAWAQEADLGQPVATPDAAKQAQEGEQAKAEAAVTKEAPPVRKTRRSANPRDTSPSDLISDTQAAPPPGLIANWLNARTKLSERGVILSARYASETAANFAGGRDKRVTETGQFDFGVLLDLEKIVGLEGGAFRTTLTWRRGYNLTEVAGLGALQQVQEVFGRGQTVRVTELWYEQKLGDRVEVKLGRTNPGSDFAVFSCHFQNLSFCGAQPGNLAGDYWYNWPVGQWGARVHVDVAKDFYLRAGVYQVNPRDLDNGFFVAHFRGATGALIPVEAGWSRGGDDGHVGTYKLGGWYSTVHGDDLLLDVSRRPAVVTGLAPLRHSGRYGVYASVQQQLSGTSKDGKAINGLGVFANVTQADRATTLTDSQVSVGLFFKGLAPHLPGDVIGLALARTNVNARASRADALVPGTPERDAETAAELYYGLVPLKWLSLQPNVQWIHHPGGVKAARDVGVVGLKAAVTL
jgi:porin